MKKEFTGTSTVESVSDNLNNEDLACVAGGLLFFWYDFFFWIHIVRDTARILFRPYYSICAALTLTL